MTTHPNIPRRPFQDQDRGIEPFYQTPEFRRSIWLLGLLLLVGLGVFFFQMDSASDTIEAERARKSSEAARAIMPAHPLNLEEKEARKVALLSKLEGALSDTENGQPLLLQTPGYLKLLEIVNRYSPEEIDQRAKIDFDPVLVMKDPDAWRGEFLRARGILKRIWAIKLERPVLGKTDVFRGVMTDGENGFLIDLLERTPGIQEEEAYDVEGVLYRTARYEGNDGKMTELPLLVVRNIHPLPALVETGWRAFLREHTLAIFAGLAFLVFGGRLLFSLIRHGQKRTRSQPLAPASFQELFDKKLREEGKVPPPHA